MPIECHLRDGVTSRLRKRQFDYASPVTCFVTICIEGRRPWFGDVNDGVVVLSDVGVVVEPWWCSIPREFPDVVLDAMIVMPDHIHGVLTTGTAPELPVSPLPEIIRWFRSHTTRDYGMGVRIAGWPPYERRFWQQGYFDHIVRNDADLDRVRAYISANPERWMQHVEG